jgi:RHS repeat-associated protein
MFRKFLTVVLCVFMVASSVIPQKNQMVYAYTPNESEAQPEIVADPIEKYPTTTDADFDISQVALLNEVDSLRTESTKTFQRVDGSFVVAMYGDVIHYQKDGKWADIDNTLTYDQISDSYENNNNGFKVKFPKNIDVDKKINLTMGNYAINWSVTNISRAAIDYSVVESKSSDMRDLSKVTQEVRYSNVISGVELQYVVSGSKVKENIILSSYQQDFEMSFIYTIKNLSLVNDNGAVSFVNESKETIFTFDDLYAFDANGKITFDIELSITELKKDEYRITISVNDEWLRNASYPVTIDPTLSNANNQIAVRDSFVDQAYPTTIYSSSSSLMLSYTTYNSLKRGLINFDFPSILSGKVITYASLALTANSSYKTTGRTIGLYANNQTFDMSSITWNNYNGIITQSTSMTDYHVTGSSNTYKFDITRTVKEWHNAGYTLVPGFTIRDKSSYGARNDVYSLEYGASSSKPVLEIGFIDPVGIKDYWTYSSQDAGLAGTGYVSDLSGTLTLVRNDLSFSSIKQSFGLSMIYSVPMKDANIGYGNGWRTNYDMNVAYDASVGKYAVIDASASKEYYHQVSACPTKFILEPYYDYYCYDAEDGSGNVLVVETDNTLNGHINYLVWNPDDVYYRFDSLGYLYEITDMNGVNQLTIHIQRYGTYPYRVDYITDDVGNKIDISYDGSNQIISANLRLMQQNYSLGRVIAQTDYTMGSGNRLVGVTFKRDMNASNGMSIQGTATYGYTTTNIMTYAQTDDATRLSYSIDGTTKRVNSITSSFDGTTTSLVTYAYSLKKTVITDQFNNFVIYKFDDFGHTVNITDSKGTVQSFRYINLFTEWESGSIFVNEDGSPNYRYNHHLISSSSPISDQTNPILNGSFEFDLALAGDGWTFVQDSGTYSSYSRSTSYSYYDNYSGVIGCAPSNKAHLRQIIVLDAGIYTLSAYVKNSTGSNGVSIDISGDSYGGVAATAPNDTDWHLLKVLFVVESDNTTITISLLNHSNNGGAAYFDGVQVYEGFTEANVNLIENPSFEYAEGSWIPGWSTLTTGITRSTLTFDSTIFSSILGTYGIRIQGLATSARSYEIDSQNVTNGQKIPVLSNRMTIGGWAKSEGTPTAKSDGDTYNRFFRIKIGMYDSSNTQLGSFQYVDFDPSITGWQYGYSTIAKETNATYLRLWIEYQGEGYVWFDKICASAQSNDTFYEYAIDSSGAPETTITEPDGKKTEITYNSNDTYTSTPTLVSYDGRQISFDTENLGEYVIVKDNITSTFEMNADGVVVRRTVGNGTDEYFDASSSILATGFGQYQEYIEDEFHNRTDYEYDVVTGLLEAIKNAKNITSEYIYDDFGNIIRVNAVDELDVLYGHVVYAYDSLGRVEKIWLDYDGHPNLYYTIHYDAVGRMEYVSIGSTQLMGYDYVIREGYETNLISVQTYGNQDQISFTYNDDNLVESISFKESTGTFVRLYGYEYAQSGQLAVKITYSPINGTTVTNREYYSFDSMGRVIRIYDELGNDYSYQYDEDGNLSSMDIKINESLEQSMLFDYNEDKQIDSVTYEALNGATVIKDYVYSTEAFDMLDEIVLLYNSTTISTNGYVYQGYTSRIVQIQFDVASQNGPDYRLRYFYDELGNIKLITSYDGSTFSSQIHYSYDALNQLILEAHYVTGAAGYAIEYEYDARGNRTETTRYTIPATTFPQYSYNFNSLHEAIVVVNGVWSADLDIIPIEMNEVFTPTFVIYDLDGATPVECVDCAVTPLPFTLNPSVRGFYQATFNATNGTTIDYDFNVRFFAGATDVSSEAVVETVSYTYDVTWIDLLRSYDIQIGNDEYTTTFTYEGNDTQGTPSVITKYLNSVVVEVIDLRWSGRSLTEYIVHGDLARTIDLYSLSFTYNDQGYRTSKTYTSTSENYTIEYTLLGSQVLYETDGSYGIYFSYDTYGNIISFNYDDDVTTIGDGDEYFYLRNLQGDIYAILDSTGQVVIRYVYDAYGNILDETFVATGFQYLFDANPYTYRGYRADRETGWYYLQSRYYLSEIGRFLNVDIYNVVSDDILRVNQFSYSINNPINFSDYCGTNCISFVDEPIENQTRCGKGGGGAGGLLILMGLGAKQLILWTAIATAVAMTRQFIYSLDDELLFIFLAAKLQLEALAQTIVRAASKVKPRNSYELHHIVAQDSPLAIPAQTVLALSGININHPVNTVWIKYEYHKVMHSLEYYSVINFTITTAWNSNVIPSISRLAVYKTLGTLNLWLSLMYGIV